MMIAAVAVSTGFAAEAVASAERRQEEARADSLFEVAVEIIKKYETMHHPRHWPLVGYGHKVLSDDSIYAVPYTSQRELHMLDSLIKADLATLPPDFRKGGVASGDLLRGGRRHAGVPHRPHQCKRWPPDLQNAHL